MATIKKNQTAEIPTKNGNKYSYQYVDIAQIHEYLEENNMSYYQFIDRIDGDDYIMTVKINADGKESLPLRGSRVVDATLFGNDNPAQKQGSALTYARRYSLLMAFGLATEDNDANDLNIMKEVTQEEADNYKLTFGKFKGQTIKEILDVKPDYIDWLLNNSKDEYILKVIELVTGKRQLTDAEWEEILNMQLEMHNLMGLLEDKGKGFSREVVYNKYGSEKDYTKETYTEIINALKKKLED